MFIKLVCVDMFESLRRNVRPYLWILVINIAILSLATLTSYEFGSEPTDDRSNFPHPRTINSWRFDGDFRYWKSLFLFLIIVSFLLLPLLTILYLSKVARKLHRMSVGLRKELSHTISMKDRPKIELGKLNCEEICTKETYSYKSFRDSVDVNLKDIPQLPAENH